MNELVIFCESYPQVRGSICLIEQEYKHRPVTVVITGISTLYEFFKLVNEKVFQGKLNIVYFNIYQGKIARPGKKIVKALYFLPDMLMERSHLRSFFRKHLNCLRGAEVFFFSRYYNPSTYYFLRELDRTNRLKFMAEPSYDALLVDKTAPSNLTEVLYWIRCKIVYGWGLSLGKHPLGNKITRMPDGFFDKRVGRVISRNERDEMLRNLDISKYKLVNKSYYKVLYLHEDLVGLDYVADAETFARVMRETCQIIGEYFPENEVAHKYHPVTRYSKIEMPFGDVLPDFIPAEFLFNESIELYLSITSAALANVENGAAISLIDMVDFRDDTIKEKLRSALIHWSHSEIKFPKSLEEFEKIIVNIKNQKALREAK